MTQAANRASLACERLARSRERLRQALQDSRPAPPADSASLSWLDGLKLLPGFDVVLIAVRAWWGQQPLRQAGENLAAAAQAALSPVAQRAPLWLLAGAAAAGGLLVWLRPWRWLPAAAVLGAVAPKLFGKIITQLPLQAWLASLAAGGRAPASGKDPSQHRQASADGN